MPTIAVGLTKHGIADVLGELVFGNIVEDTASVDPAAVVAKGVFRHLPAYHLLPAVGITGHDDNAVLGEQIEADGDAVITVKEGRGDEGTMLEAEDVLRGEVGTRC